MEHSRGLNVSTASKGRAFEHQIRELFRSAGFDVIRGAGSKGEFCGEKIDLVASKVTPENEYSVYLYLMGAQCKVRRR